MISPYTIDTEDGSPTPVLPTVCPLYSSDNHDCRIKNSHRRWRKTGPNFSLFVVVCQEHNIGFTLYPPGYYPYSRHTLAPVSIDGSLLVEQSNQHSFSGTLFDAPLNAAAGNIWCQESTEDSLRPRLTTQNLHIGRIARLFGIGVDGEPRQREEVSQILMLPGQLLHDCSAAFAEAIAIKIKGAIISRILDQIPFFATIFERLAELGAGASLWPPPLFCSPRDHMLRPTPFHPVRTRGAPDKKWGCLLPQLHSMKTHKPSAKVSPSPIKPPCKGEKRSETNKTPPRTSSS